MKRAINLDGAPVAPDEPAPAYATPAQADQYVKARETAQSYITLYGWYQPVDFSGMIAGSWDSGAWVEQWGGYGHEFTPRPGWKPTQINAMCAACSKSFSEHTELAQRRAVENYNKERAYEQTNLLREQRRQQRTNKSKKTPW